MRMALGVAEIDDSVAGLTRKNVPTVWHRGHRINSSFYHGTGNVFQGNPIPAFREITLDGDTFIGVPDPGIAAGLELISQTIKWADSYIDRRLAENESRL